MVLLVVSGLIIPIGVSSVFFERQVGKKDRDIRPF
jgi:hypothetical protein